MTETTVDKTDPKAAPKPGDKAVTTPPKPADEQAAGALAALHSDSTHPALAAGKDTPPAAPAKTESESLADKLHADLGWAYHAVAKEVKAVVADVTGTPATPPKDGAAPAPAAAGKDAVTKPAAAPTDSTAPKPAAPGAAPTQAGAPLAAKDVPPPPAAAPAKPVSTSWLSEGESLLGSAGTALADATGAAGAVGVAADVATGAYAAVTGNLDVGSIYDSLSTAVSGAATTFTNDFGSDATTAMQNFSGVAEKVSNLNTLDLNPAQLFSKKAVASEAAKDNSFAAQAAKAAGIDWQVPGDSKPGGNTAITAHDGQAIASGTNKDNVPVSAEVTAAHQEAHAGLVTIDRTANGKPDVQDGDFENSVNGVYKIERNKVTGMTLTYNTTDGSYTVADPSKGSVQHFNADHKEISTQVAPTKTLNQVPDALTAGAAAVAAAPADAGGPLQTRYFQDPNGNMEAVQSDGTIYKYNTKTQNLEVGRDNHWIERNLQTGATSYYTEDPKTHARVEVPASSLPKGITVANDGSISANGTQVIAAHSQTINIGNDGTKFDAKAKKLTTTGTKGEFSVQSSTDGSSTTLTDPSHETVTSTPKTAEITTTAPATAPKGGISFDAKGNAVMTNADGASDTMGRDGTMTLVSKNKQVTTTDAQDNVAAKDQLGNKLVNMSNQGVVDMYDGTCLNPDGLITNASRGLDYNYIMSNDYSYDPSQNGSGDSNGDDSGNGNGNDGSDGTDGSGYGNGYGNTNPDGTTADGTTPNPNGTDAANAANSIETAALADGDTSIMDFATFDKFEDKVDSTLDKLKAKWNFGKDVDETKDDKLTGREDTSDFSKWMKDVQKGDLVELPKEWKIKGLVQNLDLSSFEKGDKDAITPGVASIGDVDSLENFKDNMDALSIKLGFSTTGIDSEITGLQHKVETKLALTQSLEAAGIAPTAGNVKRAQENGNTVIANQFSSDERATA
jgi:hypothetical protein